MRLRPSTSRSATSSLPTMPMMPHMRNLLSLEDVGDADARHVGREISGIAGNQNAPANLGGREDYCVGRFQPRPLPPQSGGTARYLFVDLVESEARQKRRRLADDILVTLGKH